MTQGSGSQFRREGRPRQQSWAALLVGSALILQGDVVGRWSGSIEASGGPPRPLYARFVRQGNLISGSIGGDSTKLAPIARARLSGDTLSFDVNWGDVAHIVLVRHGNELSGTLHADGPPPPPGKHPAVITIELKRSP